MPEYDFKNDKNKLIQGDNLDILYKMPTASVDLIYIDPPFNTGKDFKIQDDTGSAVGYGDQWPSMDSYIAWMEERVRELHRVLKPTGSFYLHCDWHASHYLKVMLDRVFTADGGAFVNEIIWYYKRWTNNSGAFQRMHDSVLFYSKGQEYTFNKLMQPFSEKTIVAAYKRKLEGNKSVQDKSAPMTRNPEEGVAMHDVWEIPFLHPVSSERVDYPTQKPLALLERIIKASSNPGDIVLDCFLGSGTTVLAAEKLGRKWVGISIEADSILVARDRIEDYWSGGCQAANSLNFGAEFEVIMNQGIKNSPPEVVVEVCESCVKVMAEDPDGDPISRITFWSEGTKLQTSRGQGKSKLQSLLPHKKIPKGVHRITVSVTDCLGAETRKKIKL